MQRKVPHFVLQNLQKTVLENGLAPTYNGFFLSTVERIALADSAYKILEAMGPHIIASQSITVNTTEYHTKSRSVLRMWCCKGQCVQWITNKVGVCYLYY